MPKPPLLILKPKRYYHSPPRHYRKIVSFGLKGYSKEHIKVMEELIGCSREFFRQHLEFYFEEKMTWYNYGNTTHTIRRWNLDHVVPLARFDLTKMDDVFSAFHWSNMRPMWSYENEAKGSKDLLEYLKEKE